MYQFIWYRELDDTQEDDGLAVWTVANQVILAYAEFETWNDADAFSQKFLNSDGLVPKDTVQYIGLILEDSSRYEAGDVIQERHFRALSPGLKAHRVA